MSYPFLVFQWATLYYDKLWHYFDIKTIIYQFFNITVTLEALYIILTHSALKCCLITWRRYTYDGKYGFFFHILGKHYICGYYGQVYVGKYFSFVTASLHVKVLS